ncbi:sialidase [Pycnococcus provasolii]
MSEYGEINLFFSNFLAGSDTANMNMNMDMNMDMDGVVRPISIGSAQQAFALLPPVFPTAHAPSLAQLPESGGLLLAFFAGDAEGGDGVAIVGSRLEKNAEGLERWTTPAVISKENHRSNQNPVLFVTGERHVTLLHSSQEAFKGQGTADVRIVRSADGGVSWNMPTTLFQKAGAFTKNHVLRSVDGELLLPMYYTPDGFFKNETHYSSIQRSKDDGVTWTETLMPGTLGKCVQPSVVRLKGGHGRLLAFYRSRSADFIYKASSEDDGKTWTEPTPTHLPNNNSGIQAAVLRGSGAIVVAFNNHKGSDRRTPLTLAMSCDDGASWPHVRNLDTTSTELSYPTLLEDVLDGGVLHVAWTFGRRTIRYARLAGVEAWLTAPS